LEIIYEKYNEEKQGWKINPFPFEKQVACGVNFRPADLPSDSSGPSRHTSFQALSTGSLKGGASI